jgi:hypothetical protein
MSVQARGEDCREAWGRSPVAWALAKETRVPHARIAERLALKSAASASRQVRRFHREPLKALPKEVKE